MPKSEWGMFVSFPGQFCVPADTSLTISSNGFFKLLAFGADPGAGGIHKDLNTAREAPMAVTKCHSDGGCEALATAQVTRVRRRTSGHLAAPRVHPPLITWWRSLPVREVGPAAVRCMRGFGWMPPSREAWDKSRRPSERHFVWCT